jgi:hypothetical protein
MFLLLTKKKVLFAVSYSKKFHENFFLQFQYFNFLSIFSITFYLKLKIYEFFCVLYNHLSYFFTRLDFEYTHASCVTLHARTDVYNYYSNCQKL